jgi:hypothetical protein
MPIAPGSFNLEESYRENQNIIDPGAGNAHDDISQDTNPALRGCVDLGKAKHCINSPS